MKKIDRTGEKHTTNQGDKFTIIASNGANDCTIQFECGGTVKKIRYGNITKGSVDNPYKPTVCGVGFEGQGKFSFSQNKKAKSAWSSMLVRCYGNENNMKTPTYSDKEICNDWNCFQNFAEWFESNWKPYMDKTWQLDKDILVKGNKVYSPDTCDFVPQELNLLFTTSKTGRKLPLGVYSNGNNFIAAITINNEYFYLGTDELPEETFKIFKVAKEAHIKNMADKWRPLLSERIYQGMINYPIEITD